MTAVSPIFRASYTILNTWGSGQWESAVKMYFKLDQYVSPAMADGKVWHEKWEKYIKENLALPEEFGGKKLIKPEVEIKKVVSLEPWLDLVGRIDCFDSPTIYEFKTGKQSSESYASSHQAGIYAILATKAGLYADRAEIYHYDQYTKKYDMSLVWITDEMMLKTYNYIVTLAGEMHDYLLKNDLYNRFGGNLKPNV